jgi:hypothetical protein
VRFGSFSKRREGNKPRFSFNLEITLNEELSKSDLVGQALGGSKTRRDACRFRKRVRDEIA